MKKLLSFFILALLASVANSQVYKTINVPISGTLSTLLTANEKTTVTNLTVNGNIDTRDVKCMRDEITKLAVLDINSVTIYGYNGSDGTSLSTYYPANVLPKSSFYNVANTEGNLTLKSIKLPSSISAIGDSAFCNCSALTSIQVYAEAPIDLNTTSAVFMNVNKTACTLYVPAGSVSTYHSTNIWTEFINISEPAVPITYDITILVDASGIIKENDVTLANSSILTANEGTTKTFTFTPDEGYEVSTLTYGGMNVKSQLVNNQFTTQAINANATLSVTFKMQKFKISIQTGGSGMLNISYYYGDTPSFDFTPSKGSTIQSVFYNGEDVTNSLLNGVYTVPPITSNSTLIVTFVSIPTGITEQFGNQLKVYVSNAQIVIGGTVEGEKVTVYSVNGEQVQVLKSQGERLTLPVKAGNVYLVKTNSKTFKVVL